MNKAWLEEGRQYRAVYKIRQEATILTFIESARMKSSKIPFAFILKGSDLHSNQEGNRIRHK